MAILGLSKIWVTMGPILVINAILLTMLFIYAITGHSTGRNIHEAASRTRSKFLGVYFKEWWIWLIDPVAHLFVRLKMGPNVLTVIGFLLSVVAAFFFAKGLFGYAGWIMIFGATFDIFDGRVARLTGKESRSGAYFDSVLDRFGEAVCFLGLAWFFRESWLLPFVIAGLIGSTMVSYTKARAEGMGIECKVGSMQRPERIVYLGVASVFTPAVTIVLMRWWSNPAPILVIGAILIMAVMTNATAIYRMVYSMTAMDDEDERGVDSIPNLIARLATHEGRAAIWEKARYGYDRSRSAYAHVVLFLAHGVQPDHLVRFIESGDLPNIAEHIEARGTRARAIGTFPSTNGVATAPFVTGCFPGTCDVPGATWFDRSVPEARVLTINRFRDYMGWGAYAMDFDLSRNVRTIFEYSRRATNIFGMLNRGCGLSRDPAFFQLYSMFRRAKKQRDLEAVYDAAHLWFVEATQRQADCIFYTLPELPFIAEGDNPTKALDAYRRMDEAVGRAVDVLKKQGTYDTTALMFSSGFGRGDASQSFDLNAFIAERYQLFTHPGRPREWLEAEAIMAPSGTSMANLYLRKDDTWSERSFFEDGERRGLVGALLEREGVDCIAGRSVEGGVVVASRRGRAHVVEDHDGRITYITKGGDPFGYGDLPQVMKHREALIATLDTDYPDGIVQLMQVFRSSRAGDLVLNAAVDCNLGASDEIATHGSLKRVHLEVPFISSVPFEVAPMRTADIFCLIMNLLGIESEHHVDGNKISIDVNPLEAAAKSI